MAWEQLYDIHREAIAYARDEQARPPEADAGGEPLDAGPDGELFSRASGYQWPRDGRPY